MKPFKTYLLSSSDSYQAYFHDASDQIAQQNIQLLNYLSLVTAGLLVFFFLFTPLVLPHWTITLHHLAFLPASLLFWLISAVYQKGKFNLRFVPAVCLLFQAMLFSFVLLIDLLAAPDTPASFMPGLCIALPVLFIMPFHFSYGVMFFFEALYIGIAIHFKDPFLARYDIFNSIVGIAFSVAVAEVTMRLRLRDYTTRIKYQQLSTLDTLSGILNKKAWTESVKQYLWLQSSNLTCSLVVLDVDDFKQINDQLGHFTGDKILQRVSSILSETFRATDLVGRFGGDEFVILLKETAQPAALEKLFRRIQEQLSCVTIGERTLSVRCSIGAATTAGQGISFDALFEAADTALYQAKAEGKNTFVISACKDAGGL